MIRFFVRLAIAAAVERWIVKPELRRSGIVVHMNADASEAIKQLEWLQEQITLLDNRTTPYPVVI